MVNINQRGYEKTMKLCKELENNNINFVEFINEFEIIAFNDFKGKSLEYFNDGWSKGGVLRLMKLFLKASAGDKKANDRIIVDLGLEDVNLTIKEL